LDDPESLTRFHLRDLSWPVPDSELPSRCCAADPLFAEAKNLARRYEIDLAGFEPGFPGGTDAVIGYLLFNRWPLPRSLRGMKWTEETDIIDPSTGDRVKNRISKRTMGLEARGGEGRQLLVWYRWWCLDREEKSIPKIADIAATAGEVPKVYVERTIRKGIEEVERLMSPVEKLSAR
jgi:hypothetical protein